MDDSSFYEVSISMRQDITICSFFTRVVDSFVDHGNQLIVLNLDHF